MSIPLLPASAAIITLAASFQLRAASVVLDSVSHSGSLYSERITPGPPASASETISTSGFDNDQGISPGGSPVVIASHYSEGSFTTVGMDFVLYAQSSVNTEGNGVPGGRILSQAAATSIYRITLDGAFDFTLNAAADLELAITGGGSRDTVNGLHTSTATITLRQVDVPDLIWSPDSLSLVNNSTSPISMDLGLGGPAEFGTTGSLGPGVYEIEIELFARVPAWVSNGGAVAHADNSFTMTFTPVPEPSALLFLGGLPTLLLFARRRTLTHPLS